jgi:DNA-binding NtrC family response regulator
MISTPSPRATYVPNAKSILVVDAGEQVCELVSIYLTMHGWKVWTATDENEARELLPRVGSLDILMVDAELPDHGAHRLSDTVVGSFPNCGIVMMSDFYIATNRPHRTLLKPFRISELHREIALASGHPAEEITVNRYSSRLAA